jgi:hypothetical protein
MTRVLIDDLLRMLPWLLMGIVFSAWGALSFWIGYGWGRHRGIKDRPEVQKDALAQARFNLGVIEERLDTERKLTKRLEVVVSSLATNQHEEPRPRVARG